MTNILVYAYDTHNLLKQKIAKNLLMSNIRNGRGYAALQVFGEFFNVVTKRIPKPLSSEMARSAINHLSIFNIIESDLELVYRAIDTHQKYKITLPYDSLFRDTIEPAHKSQKRCTISIL